MKILLRSVLISTLTSSLLIACGGGGGDDDSGSGGVTSIEFQLLDPTPGRDNYFGAQVVILDNGNIVVTDPGDSSVVNENGAVHLYNPTTRALISSVYGDQADDQLGLHGVSALGNSNYVICSMVDNNGAIENAGSARLINGITGVEIQALQGDQTDDLLCRGGITVLSNNNYIISSSKDDSGAVRDAGSVRLMNGTTGAQIAVVEGDNSFDGFGLSGDITVLGNGHYVIGTPSDDVGFGVGVIAGAGSARLINGSTGDQIITLLGDSSFDLVGSQVVALGNNNYVVATPGDDFGLLTDAGSVRLMDGDGNQIGVEFGDESADFMGDFMTPLSNNNYVVTTIKDKNGIIPQRVGSVRLISGSTGSQISVLFGDDPNDALGQNPNGSGTNTVTALSNGHYVVTSPVDDSGAISDAGSVRLMNGVTGVQLGTTIIGDQNDDQMGESSITVLGNNNYIVASSRDDNDLIVDAGSVQLVSGVTGNRLALLIGTESRSRLANGGVAALGNNNYVVASGEDDNGTVDDAGSIRLFNGTTGEQINVLFGDGPSALLGLGLSANSKVINVLGNNNFVVLSPFDNTGSVRLVNGDTGVEINRINGVTSSDLSGLAISSAGTTSTSIEASITAAPDSSFYLIGAPSWNNNESNAGLVQMITP